MSKYQENTTKKYIDTATQNFKNGQINREQFNSLIGLVMNREINQFINLNLNEIVPKQEMNSMTFIQYARKRNLNNNA